MKKLNQIKLTSFLDKRISEDITSGRVGGVSVAVLQDGETLYKKHFGAENIGICPDDHTLYRIASMTKPITAAAILLQISRGLLSLNDPVAKFIPEYSKMKIGRLDNENNIVEVGNAVNDITVLHLLTHTSGIGTMGIGDKQFALLSKEEKYSSRSVAQAFASRYIAYEPYTQQSYSPFVAFDILAEIIEITSETDFVSFIRQNLLDSLKMKDSTFTPTEEQWKRIIPMHSFDGKQGFVVPHSCENVFGSLPSTYITAGAGLASTLNDYIKFAEMLRNDGKTSDGKIIVPSDSIKQMRIPHVPTAVMSGSAVWGLGVRVITKSDYALLPVGSFGWSGAYGTHFWIDPENRITAIYLKNSLYDGGSDALTGKHFESDVTSCLV